MEPTALRSAMGMTPSIDNRVVHVDDYRTSIQIDVPVRRYLVYTSFTVVEMTCNGSTTAMLK